jgi:hypothetical protein
MSVTFAIAAAWMAACGAGEAGRPANGVATPSVARAARADAPDRVVVRWHVAQEGFGTETLEVRRDGRVSYSHLPVDPDSPVLSEGHTQLSAAELGALVRTIREARVCPLRSERAGLPYEGQATLELAAEELDCSITMWDGEWVERGRPVWDAIRAVATGIR